MLGDIKDRHRTGPGTETVGPLGAGQLRDDLPAQDFFLLFVILLLTLGLFKFGLERFVNGFLDLLSLSFLQTFGKKPMHFFGYPGILMFLIGGIMAIWIIIAKLVHQARHLPFRAVTDQPLFYLALVAVILGVLLFLAGLVCEMVSRTSSGRNIYNISDEI